MDLLDEVAESGRGLLARVDAVLTAGGAPAGDPVWPLLREMRALPGDVFAAVIDTAPAPFDVAVDRMATLLAAYRAEHALLATAPAGAGATADVLRAQCAALAGHLNASPGSLADRLDATRVFLDETTGWLAGSRQQMAVAMARCLGSADAVVLHATPAASAGQVVAAWLSGDLRRTGQPREVCLAAARLAVPILAAGAAAYRSGRELSARWSGRLVETRYRVPATGAVPRPGPVTHLPL